jgi:hypothetical protein
MSVLFQRDEILPLDLVEDVVASVHLRLQTDSFAFLTHALAIIARYLNHCPDQLTQQLDTIGDFMRTRIMDVVEDDIQAMISFLIEMNKFFGRSIDAFMRSHVTPVILASKLYQLESSMSASDEIALLLAFLDPRAIPIMLEYYIDQIPLRPITYLVLIGRLFDQLPSEIAGAVMMQAKELVFDADDLTLMIRHFWKACLAARVSRPELAPEIENHIGELLNNIETRTGWLGSASSSYQKPFLQLMRYCIRYTHPWHIKIINFLLEKIQNCPHNEFGCGYLRTYADLLHRGLIPKAYIIQVDFLIHLLAGSEGTETIEVVYSFFHSFDYWS